MPKAKVLRADWVSLSEGQEGRLQEACKEMRQRKNMTHEEAAAKYQVCIWTLRRRYLTLNGPAGAASAKRQLLTPVQ